MPYIEPEERLRYEPELSDLCKRLDLSKKGHLTYLVFTLAKARWVRLGESYTNISDSIGALRDAADQIREDDLIGYEKRKKMDNGDIVINKDGSVFYD